MLDPPVLLFADKFGDFGHLGELVDGLCRDLESPADLVSGACVTLLSTLPRLVDLCRAAPARLAPTDQTSEHVGLRRFEPL